MPDQPCALRRRRPERRRAGCDCLRFAGNLGVRQCLHRQLSELRRGMRSETGCRAIVLPEQLPRRTTGLPARLRDGRAGQAVQRCPALMPAALRKARSVLQQCPMRRRQRVRQRRLRRPLPEQSRLRAAPRTGLHLRPFRCTSGNLRGDLTVRCGAGADGRDSCPSLPVRPRIRPSARRPRAQSG